jgi:hypothetical protein
LRLDAANQQFDGQHRHGERLLGELARHAGGIGLAFAGGEDDDDVAGADRVVGGVQIAVDVDRRGLARTAGVGGENAGRAGGDGDRDGVGFEAVVMDSDFDRCRAVDGVRRLDVDLGIVDVKQRAGIGAEKDGGAAEGGRDAAVAIELGEQRLVRPDGGAENGDDLAGRYGAALVAGRVDDAIGGDERLADADLGDECVVRAVGGQVGACDYREARLAGTAGSRELVFARGIVR